MKKTATIATLFAINCYFIINCVLNHSFHHSGVVTHERQPSGKFHSLESLQ